VCYLGELREQLAPNVDKVSEVFTIPLKDFLDSDLWVLNLCCFRWWKQVHIVAHVSTYEPIELAVLSILQEYALSCELAGILFHTTISIRNQSL
jgi:hypothetical protein